MTLPALLLQKPHAKSKVQERIACLRRCLSRWDKGDIIELLKEGRAIQRSMRGLKLPRNTNDDAKVARKFSNLMMKGKVRVALQLLTKETGAGPMRLDDVVEKSEKTVRDILKDKHPQPEPLHPDALLSTDIVDSDFHPVLFDSITAEAIRKSALLTEGSAGLSGMDALCWRCLCTCTAFGEKSNELCSAIAAFAKKEFAPLMLIPQV